MFSLFTKIEENVSPDLPSGEAAMFSSSTLSPYVTTCFQTNCSVRSSRSVSSCRPCAGEWGWTLQWTRICLWAPGPPWRVLPTRSNRTSSTIRNPSLPMRWGDPTPMTRKCWCGGRGGERRLWLSHPNKIEWLIMLVFFSHFLQRKRWRFWSQIRERETLWFPSPERF